MSPLAMLIFAIVVGLATPAVRRSRDPVVRVGGPIAAGAVGASLVGIAVAGLGAVLAAWGLGLLGAGALVALALAVRPSGRAGSRRALRR